MRGSGPAGGLAAYHRPWRWADPGNAIGISGAPNNKSTPTNEGSSFAGTRVTAGNEAGANQEAFSFHPGGVNALFVDGSVHFLKSAVSLTTLRGLITISGGEVLDGSSY